MLQLVLFPDASTTPNLCPTETEEKNVDKNHTQFM